MIQANNKNATADTFHRLLYMKRRCIDYCESSAGTLSVRTLFIS